MKQHCNELLYGTRDGANSLQIEGGTHSRGTHLKKNISQWRDSFEGTVFQGVALSWEYSIVKFSLK